MIPNKPQQLLRLPPFNTAIRALRERTQAPTRGATKLQTSHMLPMLV